MSENGARLAHAEHRTTLARLQPSMINAGMGRTFKLISRRDTLLGTVTVPAAWAERLLQRGAWPEVRFHYWPDGRGSLLRYWLAEEQTLTYSVATIRYHDWTPEFGPTVELYGITPEQFERLEGCSFSPGAGYLRSLLSE